MSRRTQIILAIATRVLFLALFVWLKTCDLYVKTVSARLTSTGEVIWGDKGVRPRLCYAAIALCVFPNPVCGQLSEESYAILTSLHNEDATVSQDAIVGISKLSLPEQRRLLPILVPLLDVRNRDMRLRSSLAVGMLDSSLFSRGQRASLLLRDLIRPLISKDQLERARIVAAVNALHEAGSCEGTASTGADDELALLSAFQHVAKMVPEADYRLGTVALDMTRHPERDVRSESIHFCSQCDPVVAAAACHRGIRDEDPQVRLAAVESAQLAIMIDPAECPRFGEIFLRGMIDEDENLRMEACWRAEIYLRYSSSSIDGKYLTRLQHAFPHSSLSTRLMYLNILQHRPSYAIEIIDDLSRVLEDTEDGSIVRSLALESIYRIVRQVGARAENIAVQLEKELGTESSFSRFLAASALLAIDKSKYSNCRQAVYDVLTAKDTEFGTSSMLIALDLAHVVVEDRDERLCILLSLAESESGEVRKNAIVHLSEFFPDGPEVLTVVSNGLRNKDKSVRLEAARLMLTSPETKALAISALSDLVQQEGVANESDISALLILVSAIEDDNAAALIQKSLENRSELAFNKIVVLLELSKSRSRTDALVEAVSKVVMEDDSPAVRRSAIRLLGRWKTKNESVVTSLLMSVLSGGYSEKRAALSAFETIIQETTLPE